MDYYNDGVAHVFKTFCAGYEIKNGVMHEIRKIRFFNIDQTRQGFICDNFKEANDLSWIIRGSTDKILEEKYPIIKKYLQANDNIWVKRIALSVMAFIKYGAKHHKPLLDRLDCDLLNKYDVDYEEFISLKKVEQSIHA